MRVIKVVKKAPARQIATPARAGIAPDAKEVLTAEQQGAEGQEEKPAQAGPVGAEGGEQGGAVPQPGEVDATLKDTLEVPESPPKAPQEVPESWDAAGGYSQWREEAQHL